MNLDELAARYGRLMGETDAVITFLENLAKRDDVPLTIKEGAAYYARNLNETREG